MTRSILKKPGGHLLLIGVLSIIAMLPIYYSGVPGGNDQPQHFQFARTVYDSVAAGDLYPSLAGDTNRGLGDYGLRFYPPLAYYAVAAAFFFIGDWFFASLLTFTLAFFAGGAGVYLWAKEEFEPRQALIAAGFYIFAPYHLNQLYNNALFAEFFAMAVIPFCLLFLTRVCHGGKWIDAMGLAVAYALLILTHLPLTMIGSAAMFLYGLLLLRKTDIIPTAGKLAAAVAAAVMMTAFYWSRWLPEVDWIKHSSPKYFTATWDYRSNFLLLPDHFLRYGEDALNLWLADLMLFVTLLIGLPTLVYLLRKKINISKYVAAVSTVLAFAFFMTTPLSSFIWNNIGFLQKIQFPWRWLAVTSIFGSVFASVGIVRAADEMKNSGGVLLQIGLGAILVVFVFSAAFVAKGALYIPRGELNRQMAAISGSEGCECWWPIWAGRAAFGQPEKVVAPGRSVEVGAWTATGKRFRIGAGEPVDAAVKAFYYPRWRAAVNGVDVPVEKDENGVITIALPPEPADVHLVFREPAYVGAANVIAGAAWAFVFAITGILLIKSRGAEPRPVEKLNL